MRDTIDFMIVGFGRCGTTTLFEHLRRHPDIFIPRYKECPFIAGETKTEYMRRHFPKNYKGKKIGAVTPQWMQYPELFNRWFPDAKIIMITRNVDERTASHLGMLDRRGEPNDWEHIKDMSNYSKWINEWDKYSNIFVTNLEILAKRPQTIMNFLYRNIGVKDFIPNSIGKVYNVGYTKMNPVMKFFKRLPLRHLVPQFIKRRIWRFLEMRGNK